MSKKWCEDNKAEKPVDRRKGIENTASFKANGTGPYRLKERQPSVKTVLVRNFNWWGKQDGNVDEVVFTPIGNDATRVAALLSGEIDLWSRCRCRTWSASSPTASPCSKVPS